MLYSASSRELGAGFRKDGGKAQKVRLIASKANFLENVVTGTSGRGWVSAGYEVKNAGNNRSAGDGMGQGTKAVS